MECAGEGLYKAHFPMLLPCDMRVRDGDLGNYAGKLATSEILPAEFHMNKGEYTMPYIYLVMKYREHGSHKDDTTTNNAGYFDDSVIVKNWVRVSVPCLSVTMVNSSKRLEVLSGTVTDFDLCQITTENFCNTTMTLSSLQFDNQLPKTMYPV